MADCDTFVTITLSQYPIITVLIILFFSRTSELTAASASSADCLRAQMREQRARYE